MEIDTILFDVGGTLRSFLHADENVRREKVQQIIDLLGVTATIDDFSRLLASRTDAYRRWARDKAVELNEADMWTAWMLPDLPAGRVSSMAVQLNQLWREATGIREMLPEAKDALLELFRRGYRLGIVSNTISSTETPAALKQLEISGLFETVVLSCDVGKRKPDPSILFEAVGRMGVQPRQCAYVGDRHDRDVAAARKAGFSKAVIVRSMDRLARPERDRGHPPADAYVDNLQGLLGVFPPLSQRPAAQPLYDASCSTMWARHNFPNLSDFFEAARRLGFTRAELNHQIDSSMLTGLDLRNDSLSSIHEPCPADISVEELKARDWLVSSTDQECRRRGVEAIQRSIDLATQVGIPVIVVHAGMVSTDSTLEQKLRNLFEQGQTASDEYHEVQTELIQYRHERASACMDSVKTSLRELLEYAGRFGIRLGLENRYHYFDIPNPDEMGELLALADPGQLGFVYDVGHAQHLDRLGFYPHEDWLRRFSSRILEVHLHDVKGLLDHQAPGLGDVDFRTVASYLPPAVIRTLELQSTNTPEQVRVGLQHLADCGCIRRL